MPVLGSVVENKSVNVHNAQACLSSYILRTIVQKAESVDVVLRDWSSRLVPLSTMVNMILDKWDAVRAHAATHPSLRPLSLVARPKGTTLGSVLSLEDRSASEYILHDIVCIPLEVVRQMRALHAMPSTASTRVHEAGAASSRKRGRGEPSMRAEVCSVAAVSGGGAGPLCVARCGSCAQGCGCTEWDETNHTKVDDSKACYVCYERLCAKQATPTSVEHILDGKTIVISTVATGSLATDEARGLCDTMMAGMRQLAQRRTHAQQHEVQGGRFQLRRPPPRVYRNWNPKQKKRYFNGLYKHLSDAHAGERDNLAVYNDFVERSHRFASLREQTVRRGLRTFFGDEIRDDTPVDAVGSEGLLAFRDAREQGVHGDLPPDGTVQTVTHLNDANESTTLMRFRGGCKGLRDE